MPASHTVTTKDDVPLKELFETTTGIVNIFNEAQRPFRDLFAEQVDQQTFTQDPNGGELTWEELAEGEAPRTGDVEESQRVTVRIGKYGRALGFSQDFIEDHTESQVLKRFRKMVAGAKEREEQVIFNALKDGIADGRKLWYDVPDYGEYTFTNTHDHYFDNTDELFPDSASGTAHEVHSHISKAKADLTHHGFTGPFVALVSSSLKRQLRDEVSWDAQYHVPMASNMRSADVMDLDIIIDGVRIIETPWITNDEFYITQVNNDSPLKFYERRPVQVTAPNGGRANMPGELIGASGSARFGVKMVDPIRAAYVNADQIS